MAILEMKKILQPKPTLKHSITVSNAFDLLRYSTDPFDRLQPIQENPKARFEVTMIKDDRAELHLVV